MTITQIQASYGVTINVGDYSNIRVEVGLWATLDPGDTHENCTSELRLEAEREVARRVKELRLDGVKVHEMFTKALPESPRPTEAKPKPEPETQAAKEQAQTPLISDDQPQGEQVKAENGQVDQALLAACVKFKGNQKTGKAYYDFMVKQPAEAQAKFIREQGADAQAIAPPAPSAPELKGQDKLRGLIASLVENGVDIADIESTVANVCDGESQIGRLTPERAAKAILSLTRMLDQARRENEHRAL